MLSLATWALAPCHSRLRLGMNCHHGYFDTPSGNNKTVTQKKAHWKTCFGENCGCLFWALSLVLTFFFVFPRLCADCTFQRPPFWQTQSHPPKEGNKGTATWRHGIDITQPKQNLVHYRAPQDPAFNTTTDQQTIHLILPPNRDYQFMLSIDTESFTYPRMTKCMGL